ncbi:MAG: nicotinate phosphoribosyltransferase [Pseudonocardiales bacterium]|nr:nicotinate phosphoribosyltransferase [Pseudonocardiales bacterium]
MTTALLTDRYELTMLVSALRDGTARRQCVFELFARRLPEGRRYGVVAGTARLIDAIAEFTFDAEAIDHLRSTDVINDQTAQFLATYRFAGDIDGYPEGELYFPQSPVLTVTGTFAEAVVLETLALSVLNHDCAVASAGARMVTAAAGRPIIEMGSRRTHERAAVAAARSAYLAGFASTSNLEASRRYGVPTAGTAAHSFTLLHDDERAAFAAQVDAFGPSTTLLVDTYDIARGIELAVEVAGPSLGAIRIDSGDLGVLAKHARAELDRLGATGTRIVLSGDLDEYSIASLAAAPVDAYGAGTAVVTGSGAPTAGMVYKLVEVDGRPVAKRSEHKESHGGRKTALRAYKPTGTAIEEIVTSERDVEPSEGERLLQRAFVRAGSPVPTGPTLEQSRDHLRDATITLPWDGLKLSKGEPAIPTRIVPAR